MSLKELDNDWLSSERSYTPRQDRSHNRHAWAGVGLLSLVLGALVLSRGEPSALWRANVGLPFIVEKDIGGFCKSNANDAEEFDWGSVSILAPSRDMVWICVLK